MKTYRCTPHCRWAEIEDAAVVLSLRDGIFFGLDARAKANWVRFISGAPCDPSESLLRECLQRGLLEPVDVAQRDSTIELPRIQCSCTSSTARALWEMVKVRRMLRRYDFASAYRYAETTSSRHARNDTSTETALERATAHFLMAEGLLPSRKYFDDCLPRSLALHVVLRRLGLPSKMHIGARLDPFAAHAWVCVNDRPVLDDPTRLQNYSLLDTLP